MVAKTRIASNLETDLEVLRGYLSTVVAGALPGSMRDQIDDVVQETLLRAFVSLSGAAENRSPLQFRGWLHTIAKHESLRRMSGFIRRTEPSLSVEPASAPRDPLRRLECEEALASLEPRTRCVVTTCLLGGGTREASARIGVGRREVQRILRRGVAVLRHRLS